MWELILAIVVAFLVYLNIVKPLQYWKKKGISYVKPLPLLGNMAPTVFRQLPFCYWMNDLYKTFADKRYFGLYQFRQPTLIIRDIELIKKITIKDFDSFSDHRSISSPADQLWSRNLFALKTKDGWQDMRATLSPTFTSSKIKSMFFLMQRCAYQFTDFFQKQPGLVEIELKDTFTRYTNDVIATTAFGVTCDSLKDRQNEFYLMGKDAANFTGTRLLKIFGYTISPTLMKMLKVTIFSKEVSSFFRGLIKVTLKIREEQKIVRPDMIHLLMEARKGRLKDDEQVTTIDAGFSVVEEFELGKSQKRQKPPITDDDITAQALIFFLGGFESISNSMCHAVYELALNPDIQAKLRDEVDDTSNTCGGKLTYEALMSMKYLDNVVSETLRKWPVGILLDRLSTKPYVIEPELPHEKPLYIEENTICWIPIFPIHRDPKHYPDPEKFDPERFNDENKHNIKPFAYLPFGAGPRNCIGSRFALLETKLIIVELLRKFEIVPISKTQIPIALSKKNFNLVGDEGFWLGLQPRMRC